MWWIIGAIVAWGAVSIVVALVIGRTIRRADEMENMCDV
jgi:hypothetical protein